MKKYLTYILVLIAVTCCISTIFAQDKQVPPPEKEIPFDKAPAVIKQVSPSYPEKMLQSGLEATIYLKAFIDLEGNVVEAQPEQVKLLTTKGPEGEPDQKGDSKAFEDAALSAIKQWKFAPAQMHGKPVAVWVTIPFRFKLSTKESKPEDEAERSQAEKNVDAIKTVIENILKGVEIENAKKYVEPSASLIYNNSVENLLSVLNGQQKNVRLTEGKDAKCINIKVKITGGGNSGLIVWTSELPKGKNKHIHSIVLTKSASGTWKIINWHVSS